MAAETNEDVGRRDVMKECRMAIGAVQLLWEPRSLTSPVHLHTSAVNNDPSRGPG